MAKKVVNVALHKKKPIKPVIKKGRKLKAMLKRFTHYMKTDSYMYSLLESTKPSRALLASASSGLKRIEETSIIHDQMEKTTPQSKPIAFRHVVERETVKRVVLQKGGSHVTENELLQEELDTIGAKRTQ